MGYEAGPIRPPSEANSLLLRITRNCPWNRCTFCGLYKNSRFSPRRMEDIKNDIDLIKAWTDYYRNKENDLSAARPSEDGSLPVNMAGNWYYSGMRSIFLQDANSLVIKPERIIEILEYLRETFPDVDRITSYARSHTITRIDDEALSAMAKAGLNRIHIGLESGCDRVLELVKKGADKQTHILAGRKVKEAGIELSEYYMPGLGGIEYSRCNAMETADALNRINPDFIRIRSLGIPDGIPLATDYEDGIFTRMNDIETVEELRLMISGLEGISSTLKSDHILNLLPEVRGRLPEDKDAMLGAIDRFLNLSGEMQMLFRIGRRTGRITRLDSLQSSGKADQLREIADMNHINHDNIDEICDTLLKRFI